MDLEKTRVKTRIKLPYIPVTGELAIRLPSTVLREKGDNRMVGCITGWALNKLGMTVEQLAAHKNPDQAAAVGKKTAAAVPHGLFTKAAGLHDKQRIKESAQALKAEVAANRVFLTNAFGYFNVSQLEAGIDKILADYEAKDNPKPVLPPVYRR